MGGENTLKHLKLYLTGLKRGDVGQPKGKVKAKLKERNKKR